MNTATQAALWRLWNSTPEESIVSAWDEADVDTLVYEMLAYVTIDSYCQSKPEEPTLFMTIEGAKLCKEMERELWKQGE